MFEIRPLDRPHLNRENGADAQRLVPWTLLNAPFEGSTGNVPLVAPVMGMAATVDGQGYWLAQKRLSKGRFVWWPESDAAAKALEAYEAQLLMAAGDLSRVRAAPMWRRVGVLK